MKGTVNVDISLANVCNSIYYLIAVLAKRILRYITNIAFLELAKVCEVIVEVVLQIFFTHGPWDEVCVPIGNICELDLPRRSHWDY